MTPPIGPTVRGVFTKSDGTTFDMRVQPGLALVLDERCDVDVESDSEDAGLLDRRVSVRYELRGSDPKGWHYSEVSRTLYELRKGPEEGKTIMLETPWDDEATHEQLVERLHASLPAATKEPVKARRRRKKDQNEGNSP